MKGFLIFVALLIAAGIYFMSDFAALAKPLSDHIAVQEGSVDAMQLAAQADGFSEKYRPFLDERARIAHVASLMDDDYFLALSEDTYARYNGTPLQTNAGFGYIIFHRGELLDDREHYDAAAALFRQYCALFPQGDYLTVARSAINALRINHGVQ